MGDKNMYYTQRLKELRERKEITQKEIAEAIGIKQQQYQRYENGENMMPVNYLIEICKYLKVSADYILCFTDIYTKLPKK